MGYIIVLSSGMHGSGRSRISECLKELIEKKYSVLKISSGDIFRKIARDKEYPSIEDFIKDITENLELSLRIDVEIDKRLIEEIEKNSKNYDFLIVDSNLAPYYIKESALRLLIVTRLDIIVERVFKNSRIMDKKYSSIEDVKKSLIERTKRDIERYRILSGKVKGFLREVYKNGSRVIEKILGYILAGEYERIKDDEEIMKFFDGVVDNSGSLEDTLIQVKGFVKRKFGIDL